MTESIDQAVQTMASDWPQPDRNVEGGHRSIQESRISYCVTEMFRPMCTRSCMSHGMTKETEIAMFLDFGQRICFNQGAGLRMMVRPGGEL